MTSLKQKQICVLTCWISFHWNLNVKCQNSKFKSDIMKIRATLDVIILLF